MLGYVHQNHQQIPDSGLTSFRSSISIGTFQESLERVTASLALSQVGPKC
jgi:hypothetical protein